MFHNLFIGPYAIIDSAVQSVVSFDHVASMRPFHTISNVDAFARRDYDRLIYTFIPYDCPELSDVRIMHYFGEVLPLSHLDLRSCDIGMENDIFSRVYRSVLDEIANHVRGSISPRWGVVYWCSL